MLPGIQHPIKGSVRRSPSLFAGTSLPYLALGALQVAGDHGVLGPVQHPAELLAQLQRRRTHQPRGFPPDPDEDVRPAIQDVHALGVQQALQL